MRELVNSTGSKIRSVVICLLGCLFFVACQKQAKITLEDVPDENMISTPTDSVVYTEEELNEESSVIAKVEVMDELSSENSLTDFSEEYGMVTRFCAVRSVRLLELYKDDGKLSVGDEFKVQESCAIYEADGEYFQETMDEILPLKKGETYILYVDDGADTMSGEPGILRSSSVEK